MRAQVFEELRQLLRPKLLASLSAGGSPTLIFRGADLGPFFQAFKEQVLQNISVPCYAYTDDPLKGCVILGALSSSTSEIQEKLSHLGVHQSARLVWIDVAPASLLEPKLIGPMGLWCIYPDKKEVADYYFAAAEQGLLALGEDFEISHNGLSVSIFHFIVKNFHLRHPTLNDLPALVKLEQICWPKSIAMSESTLRNRVSKHPENQVVLEAGGKVLGVIYSQPIRDEEQIFQKKSDTVDELYEKSGSLIQILALNVFPENLAEGFGDDLLEFMLRWATLQNKFQKVLGVTRWSRYNENQDKAPEEYLNWRNAEGHMHDPVTHMHENHGGLVKALVPAYRVKDFDNLGFGVLVEYDLETRLESLKSKKKVASQAKIEAPLTRQSIASTVDEQIIKLLPVNRKSTFDPGLPLMDLGLDSLGLMELRDSLSQIFKENLHATFFFQYGTAERISNYFIESLLERYYDWLYTLEFRALHSFPKDSLKPNGLWVIFSDNDQRFSHALKTELELQGQRVAELYLGNEFRQKAPLEFLVRLNEADIAEVFARIPEKNIEGIIYLWAIPGGLPRTLTLNFLDSYHRQSCEGILFLLKALNRYLVQKPPQLWIILEHSNDIADGSALIDAPLAWLSGAIMTELPEFSTRQLVLNKNSPLSENINRFIEILKSKTQEEQILWFQDSPKVPRLIRLKLPEKEALVRLDPQATYVIVGGCGGLGNLGLFVAEWHIERGAKRLLLIDPTPISRGSQSFIQDLRKRGAEIIQALPINLTQKSDLEKVVKKYNIPSAPIKGIAHVLGLIDDDKILNLNWARFKNVMQYKIPVTWILHELSEELSLPLDHFILFSAVGSIMGPLWRSSRSAANGFLSALAHFRRAKGLPALVIDWGPWRTNITATDPMYEVNVPEGMRTLNTKDGMKLLTSLYHSPLGEVIVADIDWSKFLKRYAFIRPLFNDICSELGLRQSEILFQLQNLDEAKQKEILVHYLQQHLARVLFKPTYLSVDPEKPLTEIGLDELRLEELKKNIQYDLGSSFVLPREVFHLNTTLHALAASILDPVRSIRIERRRNLQAVSNLAMNEPIAIIGMSCRFPGGVNNPEEYWNLLKNGVDAITEVPSDRWDIDAYYDPDRTVPGKMYTRFGGFIKNVDLFEPQFFNISPREAEDMDPQQRISLEVTWEALENAGIPPYSLKGSKTGVFMGICFNDYGQLIRQSGDIAAVDNYYSTGNHYSVSAGRISYILGLEGPAMAIDTACSSSLVSIDNAVKHLRLGECDLAIAGGVNLILAPESTINFCKSGMLSEDGRCKTFDARASGYVRSEGCGILILKTLSKAQKDHDRILAVIRATAINQDGASTGLTVPNQKAQENVIKAAVKQANIKPEEVNYVEAHGTGTPLGDPIEMRAITATYGANRNPKHPLLVGSAKTNIGHTEAAAGVAGLIKCVLALQHQEIPMNLHFHQLNPHIEIDPKTIKIPSTTMKWESFSHPRLAAVSSFGFSGTNSHAIISESPAVPEAQAEQGPFVIVLSAKTQKALLSRQKELLIFLEENPSINLSDVAYTLQVGREHFDKRNVFVANSREELLSLLGEYSENQRMEPFFRELMEGSLEKWLSGESIDFNKFYQVGSRQKLSLPTYPFQRKRYWVSSVEKVSHRPYPKASLRPMLSEKQALPGNKIIYRSELDVSIQKFLQDHQVYHSIILPAAGYVEMCLELAEEQFESSGISLEGFTIQQALKLDPGKMQLAELVLTPDSKTQGQFQIEIQSYHESDETWVLNTRSHLSSIPPEKGLRIDILKKIQSFETELLSKEFYRDVDILGLNYGPVFQAIQKIWMKQNEAIAEIELSPEEDLKGYLAHPALLDACYQLFVLPSVKDSEKFSSDMAFMPIGIEKTEFFKAFPRKIYVHSIWPRGEGKTNQGLIFNDLMIYDSEGDLLMKVKGFAAKEVKKEILQRAVHEKSLVENWLYEKTWQKHELVVEPSSENGGRLILVNSGSVDDQKLEEVLRGKFKSVESIIINSEQGYYDEKLSALNLNNTDKVVFVSLGQFWDLRNKQETKLRNLLLLSQALTKSKARASLWIITQGADEYLNSQIDISEAAVVGFARAIAIEHPDLDSRRVDVESNITKSSFEKLAEILQDVSRETEILLRSESFFVPRLLKSQLELREKIHLDQDSTYVITGGLGGLGQVLMKWLSSQGVKNIALLGLSPRKEALEKVEHLKESGFNIQVFYSDLSNFSILKSTFDEIEAQMPRIAYIFHLAGVDLHSPLEQQTWEDFEKVFSAKVYGAWNLHKLSENLNLKGFVLFSSMASMMGSPRQVSYSAANAVLDSLAHLRRQKNLPALSLDWGSWGEAGMAVDVWNKFFSDKNALISPGRGLEALSYLMNTDLTQVGVVTPVFMNFMLDFVKEKIPYLEKLMMRPKEEKVSSQGFTPSNYKAIIKETLKNVLSLSDEDLTEEEKNFFDMGMDSIMSIQFRNQLAERFPDITIPTSLSFEFPSIAKLEKFFSEKLGDVKLNISSNYKDIIRETLKTVLNLSDEDLTEEEKSFFDMGMDSIMSIQFRNQLAERFPDITIPTSLSFEFPSIAKLEKFFSEKLGDLEPEEEEVLSLSSVLSSPKWLLREKTLDKPKMRVFCFHHAGGTAGAFRGWQEQVPEGIELNLIQLPGRDERFKEPLIQERREVIFGIVQAILPYLDRPYIVFAQSMGTMIAAEVVKELRSLNLPLPQHMILSCFTPLYYAPEKFAGNSAMSNEAFIDYAVKNFQGIPDELLKNSEMLNFLLPIVRADFGLVEKPFELDRKFDIPITAIHCTEDAGFSEAEVSQWARVTTRDCRLISLPGPHLALLKDPKPYIDVIVKSLPK